MQRILLLMMVTTTLFTVIGGLDLVEISRQLVPPDETPITTETAISTATTSATLTTSSRTSTTTSRPSPSSLLTLSAAPTAAAPTVAAPTVAAHTAAAVLQGKYQKFGNFQKGRGDDNGKYRPEIHNKYASAGINDGKYRPDDRGKYIHRPVPYNGGYGDKGAVGGKYIHNDPGYIHNDRHNAKDTASNRNYDKNYENLNKNENHQYKENAENESVAVGKAKGNRNKINTTHKNQKNSSSQSGNGAATTNADDRAYSLFPSSGFGDLKKPSISGYVNHNNNVDFAVTDGAVTSLFVNNNKNVGKLDNDSDGGDDDASNKNLQLSNINSIRDIKNSQPSFNSIRAITNGSNNKNKLLLKPSEGIDSSAAQDSSSSLSSSAALNNINDGNDLSSKLISKEKTKSLSSPLSSTFTLLSSPTSADNERKFYDGWKIIRDDRSNYPPYHYLYETENKILAEETGRLHSTANGNENSESMKAFGFYQYYGDDGKKYHVDYIANEYGFIPQGDHIHKSIQRALAYQLQLAKKSNENLL